MLMISLNEVTKIIEGSYILLNLKAENKEEAISEMLIYAESKGLRINIDKTINFMYKKEEIITSGLGYGVAFPHVRTSEVEEDKLIFAVSKEGLNYYALDNKPVHLLAMFLTPAGKNEKYLNLLSIFTKVSRLSMYTVLLLESRKEEEFKNKLITMVKDIIMEEK